MATAAGLPSTSRSPSQPTRQHGAVADVVAPAELAGSALARTVRSGSATTTEAEPELLRAVSAAIGA